MRRLIFTGGLLVFLLAFSACGKQSNKATQNIIYNTVSNESIEADNSGSDSSVDVMKNSLQNEDGVFTEAEGVGAYQSYTEEDIEFLIQETATNLGIVKAASPINAKYEKMLFQFMFLKNVYTSGGAYVMPAVYGDGCMFAMTDINGDQREEVLLCYPHDYGNGPEYNFVEVCVPADRFSEGNLIGAVAAINTSNGIMLERSDGITVTYYKLFNDTVRLFRQYTFDHETELMSDTEQFFTRDETGTTQKVSGREARALNDGVVNINDFNIEWHELTPENLLEITRK